jgi:hypothetical protein
MGVFQKMEKKTLNTRKEDIEFTERIMPLLDSGVNQRADDLLAPE